MAKKKAVLVGIALIAAIWCWSCGGSEYQGDQPEIVIEMWDYPRAAPVDRWQHEQISQFMKDHPYVHVDLIRQPWDSGANKLNVAVFSGNPPDIAGSVSNLIAYVEQGVVEPWDDYFTPEEIEDFYPTCIDVCRWDGKIWAMPWYKTAYVMLLNLNLFREAGVVPPENHQWTWEEFVDSMEKLTVDRDGDGVTDQYGIGFNIYPEQFEAWAFLYTEGTKILSDDGRQCLFNSPETVKGVQKLYDLVHKYKVAPPRSGSLRHYETWNYFTNEWRTAVTCQGIWAVNVQRERNRYLSGLTEEERNAQAEGSRRIIDFDVALFPAPATQPPVLASTGVGTVVIFKQKDARKRDLCFELVKRMTTGGGQRILAEFPLFPTRRSASNIYDDDPLLGDLLPYGVEAKSHPMHPEWVNVDRILSKELQLAVLGNKPIEDAVRDGAEQVQTLLDRYYERRRKK